jgi:hypothetical protein
MIIISLGYELDLIRSSLEFTEERKHVKLLTRECFQLSVDPSEVCKSPLGFMFRVVDILLEFETLVWYITTD